MRLLVANLFPAEPSRNCVPVAVYKVVDSAITIFHRPCADGDSSDNGIFDAKGEYWPQALRRLSRWIGWSHRHEQGTSNE